MTSWTCLLALTYLGYLTVGCAHYQPPPPEPPVRHAMQERTKPETPEEELKIHRAPPPEYGNKVVTAELPAIPEG